jgi:hypothetical protein
MFGALPQNALAIHVGGGVSRAVHRLSGPPAVRRLLRALLDTSRSGLRPT